MRNKKGFLLAEETLKIVIAVICIGFLAYFLTSLYFSNLDEKKQNQAEATLEQIEIKIGEGGGELKGVTPTGWSIFNFSEKSKPNQCAGKKCICICDEISTNYAGVFGNRQLKECQKDGRCLVVENLLGFEIIEIKETNEGATDIEVIEMEEGIKLEEVK